MKLNVRVHELAVELYRLAKAARLPRHLKDQLERASSSVALNIMEGWGRSSDKDRMRFFTIAFGSVREVQSIAKLENLNVVAEKADHVAACLYKLTRKSF